MQLPLLPNFAAVAGVFTIDAANEGEAIVCRIPKSGNITKIHLPAYAAMGVLTIAVDIVTTTAATAMPTASLYGGCTAGAFSTQPQDVGVNPVTLGTPASATEGDLVALRCLCTARTSGAWYSVATSVVLSYSAFPFLVRTTNGGSSWVRESTMPPPFLLEYDDGSICYPSYLPGVRYSSEEITTAATYRECGIQFTVPETKTMSGFWTQLRTVLVNYALALTLYNPDGSVNWTMNHPGIYSIGDNEGFLYHRFETPLTLPAGTYVLAIANNTTNTFYMYMQCILGGLTTLNYFTDNSSPKYVRRATIGSGAWVEHTVYHIPRILPLFVQPFSLGSLGFPGIGGLVR